MQAPGLRVYAPLIHTSYPPLPFLPNLCGWEQFPILWVQNLEHEIAKTVALVFALLFLFKAAILVWWVNENVCFSYACVNTRLKPS